ncbi:MAG: GIY-YIG nuclease family protein [Eubacteriales bacterium]|nr:GIY-YIG nuclease family protein [Eubacteriales bacterium]
MDKQSKKEILAAYKQRKVIGGVYTITNTANGKILMLMTTDIAGSKNRFEFSQKTGSCISFQLQDDWKQFGANAFSFDILESLEKKESQTLKEFQEDLKILYGVLLEKIDACRLYNSVRS